jgi:hypothetical protein
MYTCLTNWRDVRICHWTFVVSEPNQPDSIGGA